MTHGEANGSPVASSPPALSQIVTNTQGGTTSLWVAQTTGSTLADQTWASWARARWNYIGTTTTAVTSTNLQYQWASWNNVYEETQEQRAERERAFEAARESAREAAVLAKAETEAANERALELLALCLSPEQMASYRDNGWFEVRGSKGGRWRIRNRGQAGNVDLMPEIGDVRTATYCCHPPGQLPAADAHLAQMLALVTDEEQFLKVANVQHRRAA